MVGDSQHTPSPESKARVPELHDAPMLTADDEAPVTKPSGGPAAPSTSSSSLT